VLLPLVSVSIIAIFVAAFFSLAYSNLIVSAQLVVKDETPTNATEELDVKIFPTEPLPANGTLIVDISDADDLDIETIPPEGVTIVMTNNTIAVTNEDIEIPDQDDNESPSTGTTGDEEAGDEG
jgi:hypothetical protein